MKYSQNVYIQSGLKILVMLTIFSSVHINASQSDLITQDPAVNSESETDSQHSAVSNSVSHSGNSAENIDDDINAYKEVSLKDVSSGTLLFQQSGSNRFFQAPQLKTTVDMSIEGIVANVTVKQKFTNTTNNWQHALYAFPLPDDSAVNQLKITVAERIIIGEIQEKGKALKTFNRAKSKGQKAALVEQYRPNLFSTKVANIPPNESIEVEITYFQQVDYQAGEFSLHFPMAITPRYKASGSNTKPESSLPELIFQARNSSHQGDLYASNKQKQATKFDANNQLIDLNISLHAGAELSQINSINHALIANYHSNNKVQTEGEYTLSLRDQPMNKDFKLTWQYQQKELPQVLNFQQNYQESKYGLLMVLPGLQKDEVNISRELTFVLDTSGSMSGQSLEQAKEAFKYALNSLTENDSFQLISFNSYPTQLYPRSVPATTTNKNSTLRYVNQLQSTGGTEILSALTLALENKSNNKESLQQIVFLTDGAVGNEADIFSYIANNIADKRLFTVGLGSAPNRYFMKKSAEAGRGSYQFISNHSELATEMQRLFGKLSNPVLTDLRLELNDPNGQLVTAPNPIPDLYQGEPLFLSYQLIGPQDDSLLSGIYKGKLWSLNIQPELESSHYLAQPDNVKSSLSQNTPPLATLWARRKIADHFRELMLYKKAQSKSEIITLALKYQLVTPFTSLVAVEQKISRPESQMAKAKQLKNNLPAGQKLPSTTMNWQWRFYLGSILFVFSVTFMCFVTWRERSTQKAITLCRVNNADGK